MKLYLSLSATMEEKLIQSANVFLDQPQYRTPSNLMSKVKSSRIYGGPRQYVEKALKLQRFTADQHRRYADVAFRLIEKLNAAWQKKVEREWKKLTGEKWKRTDYKVSGIARDEFPEDVKQRLRTLDRLQTELGDLQGAHVILSKQKS